MRWKICMATCVLWIPAMASWAQVNTAEQPALPRDDPATSGAGPTSGAPGQLKYDLPKGGSNTTDARGVTTLAPKTDGPKPDDVPADPGNGSFDAAPRL
jgi:hypothetical protein